MADQFGQKSVGDPVQRCPLATKPGTTYWIEIEMVGEDGLPIPWQEYRVVTAGGTKIKGYLDDQGFARIEGLTESGTCKIGFPALDKEAWQFVKTLPAKEAPAGGAA
jgi:hypothetical protein